MNKNDNIINSNIINLNKFHIILLGLLLITLLIVTSCEQEKISSEELEQKEFVVSKNVFDLVQGQKEEFFVGINNKESNNNKAKFEFLVSCENKENNCDGVFIQFFPTVEVNSNSKVALPLSFNIDSSAEEREYKFKIVVKKGEQEQAFGEENLIVNVRRVDKDIISKD